MDEKIGNRLLESRKAVRMSQQQVGDWIGADKTTISAYESGRRQPPYETLIQLANLYHVSTDFLLGMEHNRVIEADGLTPREFALISELVQDISEKNR